MKVVVSEVFALEDAARAHARMEQGHVRGKIVLRVRTSGRPG